MVIYLRHPVHGVKVAIAEFEAEHDKENGWEVFDPTAKPVEVNSVPADLPSFLAPAPVVEPEKKGRGGRHPKK